MANLTNSSHSILINVYYKSQLFSCIFILFLIFITVVGNGLLLLATWKDPFKSFKNASSSFVISLGVANILIGLLLEPVIIYIKLTMYLKRRNVRTHKPFLVAAQASFSISTALLNASFMTVLALTWCQVFAVGWPHKYKAKFTTTKCMACVCCIWCYGILFSLVPVIAANIEFMFKVDLFVNTTLVIFALIVGYIALYKAYSIHLKSQSRRMSITSEARRVSSRNFTILILLLAGFVILFSFPITIIGYIRLYWLPSNREYGSYYSIASLFCNDFLLIKFALDPIAYALRLPKYRRAFRSILGLSTTRELDLTQRDSRRLSKEMTGQVTTSINDTLELKI